MFCLKRLLKPVLFGLTVVTAPLAISLLASQTSYASIANVINYQTKLTNRSNGLDLQSINTPCIISGGADTCDFRVRIWNVSTGGTATAGNNLIYEELFNNEEIGDTNGVLNLSINSVCQATTNGTQEWGTTSASSTVCNLYDDNGDADSVTGITFGRDDLYLEITFDPSGTWTDLASPPAGIETFTRINLRTAPSAFVAQTLAGGFVAGDFVQLSPTSIQNTSSTAGAIRVNQQGSGNILQIQKSGTDRLVLDNNGQLQLSQTGITGGIKLGDSGLIYRSAANTLYNLNSVEVALDTSSLGLSNFKGNLRNILTIADGSTTTTGTGASQNVVTVSSTSNFDVGNLILVNGTTYARIDSVNSTTTMHVTPTLSWSAGQTVIEYTAVSVGGDGQPTNINQQFDSANVYNGLRAGGGSTGTTYGDQIISTTRGLRIEARNLDINSQEYVNINTTGGLVINKNSTSDTTGAWSVGTSGGTIRQDQKSVTYGGKMYSWGGINVSGYLNTMDIYDFTTKTWSTGTTGGTARRYFTAVTYNDRLYIWGGTNGGYLNTVDIYNFTTKSWSTGTSGGTARQGAVAVVYNGKMYAWGGYNGSYLNTMDIYDFSTNTWSTGTAGGTARAYHSGIMYNSKLFVWGGTNGSYLNTVNIYNFVTNTWSTGTAGGTARAYHSGIMYNNKMYEWGGTNGGYLNTMDIYDFATDTWNTGTAGGTARYGVSAVQYNGKMYGWGGSNGSYLNILDVYTFGTNSTVLQVNVGGQEQLRLDTNNVLTITNKALGLNYPLSDIDQYSTQGWSTGTSGGTARHGIVGILYNGKVYLWGGFTNAARTTMTNVMDIYNIATDSWSTGTSGGTQRGFYQAQLYNGKIYYFGGCTSSSASCTSSTTVVDIYDIANNGWTTGSSGGTSRGKASSELYNGKVYIWGGQNTAGSNINSVDIYDIATDAWTTGTAGGTPRQNATTSLYNNKMYAWGGFTTANTNIIVMYDFQTDSWTAFTAGGTARQSATSIVYKDKMYIWGGYTSSASNIMDVYDFKTDSWVTGAGTGGTARFNHTSIFYNGKMYGFEGTDNTNVFNSVDIYDLGSSKAQDVFYIENDQGNGPENGKLFRFDAEGRAYTNEQGGWFAVGADYAEYMHTNDSTIGAGDIVKLDSTDGHSVIRTSQKNDPGVLGVISTQPGFVGNITNIEDINNQREDMKLLSMVGQVPVKVSTENGDINIGDRITSSSVPGIGMKANEGDNSIGIAQEEYTSNGIGKISVLITRNNSGINNKVQINLGKNGEAGFRVDDKGKLQYKDAGGEWNNITQDISVDKSLLWDKVGDNVFSKNTGVTSIGISEENLSDSKLQVAGGIDIKDGLNVVSLSSTSSSIKLGSADIGFRVNDSNGTIEYKDYVSKEWKALSGLLIGQMRVNNGSANIPINSTQMSGWGYVQGDGGSSSLNKDISVSNNMLTNTIIFTNIVGYSDNEPKTPSECSSSVNEPLISKALLKNDNNFNITISDNDGMIPNKYICFNWIALGSN